MAYTHTVALIGATSQTGAFIASRLADQYRLLLMDTDPVALRSLQNAVRSQTSAADVDVLSCCKDASWEADTVIICVDDQALDALADRIRDVTTCKTVIQFTNLATSRLLQHLPHARVIPVTLTAPLGSISPNPVTVMASPDKDALQTTHTLLALLGCLPQYA